MLIAGHRRRTLPSAQLILAEGGVAERGGSRVHELWARLRFSVIGQLLAAPPPKGALRAALEQLAAHEWRHPSTGAPVRFGVSTLERWFYRARNERHDPVSVLRRKRRQDAGLQASMTAPLRQALLAQYDTHRSWSAQLHHDNLVALAEARSELRPVPSYATVRRFLAAHGLTRRRPMTTRQTAGALAATARLDAREVRSYESEYVNGTWHWDCHYGSRKVLTPRGEWRPPILFGVLDDRSRLACHLQWYLAESAANIAHGLSQAMQKRGLPRAAMSDNGAAMTASEITEGLARLGVVHQTTLPYSPYMNGKQEILWGSVEGRLMAMLEGVEDLTLARLNEATQAWVEYDYNRKRHSEIDDTPLARFLTGPAVTRPCPDAAALRLAFTRSERRTLRKSDGTAVIEGRRFEVPNRYRHLSLLEVRFAAWDLTQVHLVDPHTGTVLCRLFPQDKTGNAGGLRRGLQPITAEPDTPPPPARGIAPLLARMIDRQAATGLPPAYLPKDEGDDA
jgi:putative transposase